jgi:hypothetical protein
MVSNPSVKSLDTLIGIELKFVNGVYCCDKDEFAEKITSLYKTGLSITKEEGKTLVNYFAKIEDKHNKKWFDFTKFQQYVQRMFDTFKSVIKKYSAEMDQIRQ